MTKEVLFIIDNKRFKGSWTDALAYLLVLAAGLGVFTGVQFILLFSIGNFVMWEALVGLIIVILSLCLAIVAINRIRWRNPFIEIRTGRDQATNFQVCSEIVRVWRGGQARRYATGGVYKAKEIESDDWNFTINATLLYHRYFFIRSSLMVVCLNRCILINERHEFVGLVARHGLNEMKELVVRKIKAMETRERNLTQSSIIG